MKLKIVNKLWKHADDDDDNDDGKKRLRKSEIPAKRSGKEKHLPWIKIKQNDC